MTLMRICSRIVLLIACVSGCAQSHQATVVSKDFNELLDRLVSFEAATIPEALEYEIFQRADFRTEYVKSGDNFSDIKIVLIGSFPKEKKLFAVRLAQCMSLESYLDLMSSVLASGAGDKHDVIYSMVNPGIGWGTLSYRNYQDKRLSAIVESEKTNRTIDPLRSAAYQAFEGGVYTATQRQEGSRVPKCEPEEQT